MNSPFSSNLFYQFAQLCVFTYAGEMYIQLTLVIGRFLLHFAFSDLPGFLLRRTVQSDERCEIKRRRCAVLDL